MLFRWALLTSVAPTLLASWSLTRVLIRSALAAPPSPCLSKIRIYDAAEMTLAYVRLGEDNLGERTSINAALALNGDAYITQNARAFYGPMGYRWARWNHKQLIYRQQPLYWNIENASNAGHESTRHPVYSLVARVTRL